MKASRFSEAQKAFVLKQGVDGVAVAEIRRKVGISQATYFNWKKKYDGLLPTEMRRLKQLEDENAKLKRIVADLTLDKEMLQEVVRRKLFEACPEAEAGGRGLRCVGRVDPAGVPGVPGGHVDLPLPLSSRRAGRPRATNKGSL